MVVTGRHGGPVDFFFFFFKTSLNFPDELVTIQSLVSPNWRCGNTPNQTGIVTS